MTVKGTVLPVMTASVRDSDALLLHSFKLFLLTLAIRKSLACIRIIFYLVDALVRRSVNLEVLIVEF